MPNILFHPDRRGHGNKVCVIAGQSDLREASFDSARCEWLRSQPRICRVLGDVFLSSMHGPMGGRVGDVEEKRLPFLVLADESGRMMGDGVSIEIAVGGILRIIERGNVAIVSSQRIRIEKASSPVDRSENLSSPLKGPVMPLGIALRFRYLVTCHLTDRIVLVAAGFNASAIVKHFLFKSPHDNPRSRGLPSCAQCPHDEIQTRQQTGTCRTTTAVL